MNQIVGAILQPNPSRNMFVPRNEYEDFDKSKKKEII